MFHKRLVLVGVMMVITLVVLSTGTVQAMDLLYRSPDSSQFARSSTWLPAEWMWDFDGDGRTEICWFDNHDRFVVGRLNGQILWSYQPTKEDVGCPTCTSVKLTDFACFSDLSQENGRETVFTWFGTGGPGGYGLIVVSPPTNTVVHGFPIGDGKLWELLDVNGDNNWELVMRYPAAAIPYFEIWGNSRLVGVNPMAPLPDNNTAPTAIAYPNPATRRANITFTATTTGQAKLEILDVQGRLLHKRVYTVHQVGQQDVLWDGTDLSGKPVPAGVYYCKADINGNMTRCTVVLRN